MAEFIVFVNNGHGGEISGVPVTAGKRSPDDSGEFRFIEGVFNREITGKLHPKLQNYMTSKMVCGYQTDKPLKERVDFANTIGSPYNSIYLSIHADACPTWYINTDGWRKADMLNKFDREFVEANKKNNKLCVEKNEWADARGMSIWTSVGQTRSDKCADILYEEFLKAGLPDYIGKIRTQKGSDGDIDHEANFYELKNTKMPAVLIESGFMTNKADVFSMKSDIFQEKYTNAIVAAMIRVKHEVFGL